MEPWYKVTTPRAEVREGRSFNPDEFAIALEQVAAGTAPKDYLDPKKFFDRTCFTRALTEHLGLVLRRLSGETQNTAPVLSLITQFGGGKTHTLTALYHLIRNSKASAGHPDVQALLKNNNLGHLPTAKVAIFVGNAWDPTEGKETPWIDLAHQLAGAAGVLSLGPQARSTPPGTDALARLFQTAGGHVLLLFDEVLNYFNRHRNGAESFYSFLDNTARATTGSPGSAALISLPRSQVEMTDFDQQWLDRISKVVRRVAKDLIANDESEISEVVRRRLFEDLGKDSVRKAVAKSYADWCFERKHQLPPEWTAVDTITTDAKAREHLRVRFEAAYPFHPATISVFQRKWQGLPHYQRTRGTLAMFAQWISWAARESFRKARREPLITLGSAPLDVPEFQATILGQLGEQRLLPAIEVDIAGTHSHAKTLDADREGPLRDIHRRVGAAILFESTGVASDKAAYLPELRFALGEPDLDVTSIDNAATALERRSFFIKRIGTDGFRIGYKPTLKKIVGDRRAALDDADVTKAIRTAVKQEFDKGRAIPIQPLTLDDADVPDTPKLTLVTLDPEMEWDVSSGVVGSDFDASERGEVAGNIKESEEALREEVWASYRHAVIADSQGTEGVREIDLGAGHASASANLSARVTAALKAEGLLNDSVGAGYLDRNWPPALKESGVWPLKGLRQAFLDGTLTRLLDPEEVLKRQIVTFVDKGDFALASGPNSTGGYQRVWFKEAIGAEEVVFDDKTFLLTRARAATIRESPKDALVAPAPPATSGDLTLEPPPSPGPQALPPDQLVRLSLRGSIPPEQWNKLGTKLLPKLRSSGQDLSLGLDASFTVRSQDLRHVESELRQALRDLGLDAIVQIVQS